MRPKVGDKVVKNKENWKPNPFDLWGRGEGKGLVVEPPYSLGTESIDVRWPGGRCFENLDQVIRYESWWTRFKREFKVLMRKRDKAKIELHEFKLKHVIIDLPGDTHTHF